MSERGRTWLTSLLVVLLGLAVFVPTLRWGLPTRDTDKALFGERKPWTGRQILELLESPDERGQGTEEASGPLSARRGADVDATPILDRSKPVILNDTDAKRAAIVQRYRLMSKQPDEFIQFKALAEMSQRQGISKFDPRLYQYGGLWIYPVGALVRSAMLVGWIEPPPAGVSAKEFYLDHPEVFGKFYVVARAYSTMWGIVAALAIAWITRRLTNSNGLAALAAIAFILLPVTRTAAHEAKPHLAGAALCLCSVIAATRYVESGRRRYALLAGALCGAAMAMVVSMLLSLAVLPMMAWLRWRGAPAPSPGTPGEGRGGGSSIGSKEPHPSPLPAYRERGSEWASLASGFACVCLVYALTNPFPLYNAVFHPEILRSNLGNSTAMYGVGNLGSAFASALRIAVKGITPGGAILAALSLVVLAIGQWQYQRGQTKGDRTHLLKGPVPFTSGEVATQSARPHPGVRSLTPAFSSAGWLLAAPVVCVLVQFILLAAGKPAEYARFGLVLAGAAAVFIAWALSALNTLPINEIRRDAVLGGVIGIALFLNTIQWLAHEKIAHPPVMRNLEAGLLLDLTGAADRNRIGLAYEPAPWSIMPLNLFRDQLILTKPAAEPKGAIYDVYLFPSNLSSQVGFDANAESVDWAKNRTQMILGSLPTQREPATSQVGTR